MTLRTDVRELQLLVLLGGLRKKMKNYHWKWSLERYRCFKQICILREGNVDWLILNGPKGLLKTEQAILQIMNEIPVTEVIHVGDRWRGMHDGLIFKNMHLEYVYLAFHPSSAIYHLWDLGPIFQVCFPSHKTRWLFIALRVRGCVCFRWDHT